jgi:N-formylglutamate deformylase
VNKAFFISIPHSGEMVPREATWLATLDERTLMCDVDRFVDQLYGPAIQKLKIGAVLTEWHRYVIDLNRLPEDVDQNSVVDSTHPAGTHNTGLHWVKTTKGEVLMSSPISRELHQELVKKYFDPFHDKIQAQYKKFRDLGFQKIYHLDAHSMPSMGTAAHRDPGEKRAQVVVSDVDGKSCEPMFTDLVIEAYRLAGFQVACNWPYKGGRLTQSYGQPEKGQNAIQVELNRSIYMDEVTKQKRPDTFPQVQAQIEKAVSYILNEL